MVKAAGRPTRASAPSKFENEDEIEEVDDHDDDSAEMLAIMQEFKNRKAKKTAMKSATLQGQKAAIYTRARQYADDLIRDGTSLVEEAQKKMIFLKTQDSEQGQQLHEILSIFNASDENTQTLLDQYPHLIHELAPRRAAALDAASVTINEAPQRFMESRRALMLNAKAQVDESLEQQKVVTDAKDMIKHYKALLRS